MTSADGRAEREGGGPERPAGADVAEVVDAEVDAGEADQRREHDAGGDDGGAARHARPQAQHDRHREPDVEGRVGGVAAGERGARGVDERLRRARPVDRGLELVDADDDDRHPGDAGPRARPSAGARRAATAQTSASGQDDDGRAELGDDLRDVVEPAGLQAVDDIERGLVARRRARDRRRRSPCRRRARRAATASAAISEVNSSPKVPPGRDPVPEEAELGLEAARQRRRASAVEPVALHPAHRRLRGSRRPAGGGRAKIVPTTRTISVPSRKAPRPAYSAAVVDAAREEVADQDVGGGPDPGAEDAVGDEGRGSASRSCRR